MTKNVEQLDQVVIRIAGDSGDGMQLTGDRFTQETAIFGNDLATFPNFPAEIRAPQGTLAGVSSFQLHFADHDILTPGDRPDVLVAMNPAALKANLGDMPKGAHADRRHPRLHRPARWPGSAGRRNPLEDGTLEGYNVHAVDLTQLTLDALEGTELSRKDAGRIKNMFALGLLSWMYSRPTEGTLDFVRHEVREQARHRRGQHHRVQGGLELRRDHRGVRRLLRGQAGHACRPGTYRNISGNLALAYGLIAAGQRAEAAAVPGRVPDHPGQRHPARAVQAQALRRAHVPGRGRDRRHRRRAGRVVRRGAGRHHVLRAGHRAQGRDDRAGGVAGAAADHLRHPARRPVDRPADQDRAVRPAAGDVRAQRRGAGADRRAAVARRLLRRRRRGRPDRADLPHAGVPAVRRLPRQRLRAVGGPVRRRAARPAGRRSRPSPTATAQRRHGASSCPTCATRRRWPGRGRCPAPPGSSTASAASRRPTAPATSATTPTTTTSWSAPARPRSTASPARCRRLEVDDPDGDATVLVLGWGSTYGPIGAACRQVRAAGAVHRPGAPAPPQPVPVRPRRDPAPATTRSSSPR